MSILSGLTNDLIVIDGEVFDIANFEVEIPHVQFFLPVGPVGSKMLQPNIMMRIDLWLPDSNKLRAFQKIGSGSPANPLRVNIRNFSIDPKKCQQDFHAYIRQAILREASSTSLIASVELILTAVLSKEVDAQYPDIDPAWIEEGS